MKKSVFLFLILFMLQGFALSGEKIKYYRRRRNYTYKRRPAKNNSRLILVTDFGKKRRNTVIMSYKDLHTGADSEFRIYSLIIEKGKAETGSVLLRIRTSDDYCKSIQLKDLDGDGFKEILLTTITKDNKHKTLTIVKYREKYDSFDKMVPDKSIGTRMAEYSFAGKAGNNPAEMHVISAIKPQNNLFKDIRPLAGKIPLYWVKQIFLFKDTKLELYERSIMHTPFYILNRVVDALKKKSMFLVFKYYFTRIPYYKFKVYIPKKLPLLTSSLIKGGFSLNNWTLDYYRKIRTFSWMTFTYRFSLNGKKHRVMYQVFMRKVYDEWKVTLIRKIRTY